VAGCCAEVIWPLFRDGDNLILKLPPGYAGPGIDARNTSEAPVADLSVEDSLVLEALWPRLEPAVPYDFSLFPHDRMMQVLMEPRAVSSYRGLPINKLENAYADATWLSGTQTCTPQVQSSSGPVTRKLCKERKSADPKPDKFGLKRLGIDFNRYTDYSEQHQLQNSQRDIYFLRDKDGSLQSLILCTAEESKAVDAGPKTQIIGQCEHKFIDNKMNALVTVHYRRAYLEQWHDVEVAWRKLLESFVEGPGGRGA
jgi:hypothetical protein